MQFKVNSNKRRGLYIEQIPRKYVTEYLTKYGWSEFYIGDSILFSHKTNVPFGRTVIHTHEFYELTVCVDCNDATIYTDKQHLSLLPGHIILIKPNALHMYKAESSACKRDFYCLNFRKSISLFREFETASRFLNYGTENAYCLFLSQDELNKIKHILKKIKSVLEADTEYSNDFAITYILELFLIFSAHQVQENFTSNSFPSFVHKIKEYIDNNFIKIKSVSDILVSANYSREYVSRTFKKNFNISIYEYIVLKKIIYACDLINQGQGIEEAAINSGINNMSSFNKHFKKIIKMTPSEYKKLYK